MAPRYGNLTNYGTGNRGLWRELCPYCRHGPLPARLGDDASGTLPSRPGIPSTPRAFPSRAAAAKSPPASQPPVRNPALSTVLLIIHLFVTLALIGVVLIQRSEGGGLGIGTSQGMGSFMSGRGTANLLTRTTAILATIFMALSLALAVLNRGTMGASRSLLDTPGGPGTSLPAAPPPAPSAPSAPSN
jgi:preprotein translocase subunit SecG